MRKKLTPLDWIAILWTFAWFALSMAVVFLTVDDSATATLGSRLGWAPTVLGAAEVIILGYYFSDRHRPGSVSLTQGILLTIVGLTVLGCCAVAYFRTVRFSGSGPDTGFLAVQQVFPLYLPFLTLPLSVLFPNRNQPQAGAGAAVPGGQKETGTPGTT